MVFDMGNGIPACNCETLSKEPERLAKLDCAAVIRVIWGSDTSDADFQTEQQAESIPGDGDNREILPDEISLHDAGASEAPLYGSFLNNVSHIGTFIRNFPMTGHNTADLDPQQIVTRIARIENLNHTSMLCVSEDNEENFNLRLTADFNWLDDGAIRFFYEKDAQTYSAQLRLFQSENQYFVTERSLQPIQNQPAQNQRYQLYDYLQALKYLPQEEIRQLFPDADAYMIQLREQVSTLEASERFISYSPEGMGTVGDCFIHLTLQPLYRTQEENSTQMTGTGEEIIHLFYGSIYTDSVAPQTPQTMLTLDDVITLSQKGEALTWSDFIHYRGREVGFGLYVMRYEIDELFYVLVGGVMSESPWYIKLCVNNLSKDWMDIRSGDVAAFIEEHLNDTVIHALYADDMTKSSRASP